MDLSRTLILGLIAGGTIVLGLPIGRLRRPNETLRVLLTASAIGVLLFLVWDVLSAAWLPIDSALAAVHDHTGGLAPVLRYGALFVGGITAGLLSLVRTVGSCSAPPRRASAPARWRPRRPGTCRPAPCRPLGGWR